MSMLRRIALVLLLLVPLVPVVALADRQATPPPTQPPSDEPPATAKLSPQDQATLDLVHGVNRMEIHMGTMARQRSKNDQVKTYGERLVTDHERVDRNTRKLAAARGASLTDHPPAPPEADADQMKQDMAAMARLEKLEGNDFDRELITMAVAGHARTIAKVDAAFRTVSDPQVKALLAGLMPVLRLHLDKARELQTKQGQAHR